MVYLAMDNGDNKRFQVGESVLQFGARIETAREIEGTRNFTVGWNQPAGVVVKPEYGTGFTLRNRHKAILLYPDEVISIRQ